MSRSAKKEVAFIVSIVMLASSLVSLGPLSNQAQAGMTWLLETVTDQGGSKTVIDIDSAGNPWILYSGTTVATGLSLAHWNGFSWVLDVVAPGGGLCFSFALDDLNRPHVVYDGDDSPWPGLKDMHYAYWNGTSWVYETIDSQGDLGSTCSIALDPLGRPHVSYENYTWTAMNTRASRLR